MTTQTLLPLPEAGPARTARAGAGAAPCACPDRRRRVHHDRLLQVEDDVDELLALIELAVTWCELDYSEVAVVPPERWIEFAAAHAWRDPHRVERLFGLAADIALRSAPGSAGDNRGAFLQLVAR